MKKKKRRFITLVEIMIVMFLIALIIGVLGYNYTGTLEDGKAFKTSRGIEKLETILSLKVAEDSTAFENIKENWKDYVRQSPLVQNPDALIKDGWGEEYEVDTENSTITITSKKYNEYKNKHPGKYQ